MRGISPLQFHLDFANASRSSEQRKHRLKSVFHRVFYSETTRQVSHSSSKGCRGAYTFAIAPSSQSIQFLFVPFQEGTQSGAYRGRRRYPQSLSHWKRWDHHSSAPTNFSLSSESILFDLSGQEAFGFWVALSLAALNTTCSLLSKYIQIWTLMDP